MQEMGLRASFSKKAGLILRNYEMMFAYMKWTSMKLFTTPKIYVEGLPLTGIRNFGEYFNQKSTLPTQNEIQFIKRALKHNNAPALDIGSNIGQYAIAIRENGMSDVHCFEPHPLCFDALRKNCADKRYILNQCALTDRAGEVMFSDHINSTHVNRVLENNAFRAFRVSSRTVDSYLSENNIKKISLMKLDVEGAEPLVLSGSEICLENNSIGSILIEISRENLANFGLQISDITSRLMPFGYKPFLVGRDGDVDRELSESELEDLPVRNIAFLPLR